MLTFVEKILFVVVVLAAGGAAYVSFGRMLKVILRGQGSLPWSELPGRAFTGIGALISQGRIIRHRRWTSLIHYGVAWAFIFYLLVNLVDVLEGYIPVTWNDQGHFIPGVAGDVYRLLADLFSISGIVAVVYFGLRRFVFADRRLVARENVKLHPHAARGIRRDSLIVLLFVFLHLSGRFMAASFLVARHGSDPWQPFASLMAGALSGLSPNALDIGWHVCWWLALGMIVAFLPYFPYTKHAHLFMGPLNFATRPERTSKATMSAVDFEDESIEQFGVARLTDLQQTQILDAFACIMCNRCQDACPAYATGKELSPAALEINKRYYIKDNLAALARGEADELKLSDYAISESAIWACTSCGACIDVCPVGNEPMHDILDIRRDLVLMESTFPGELKQAFTGMERTLNPWNSTESRLAWADGLPFEVPTVAQNPDYEYLFWVGCAGAFEPSAQKVARAVATVLNAAGISFAVLGEDEACTGDTARRAGNEYLFYEIARQNIETLNGAGAHERRIVTSCPHCFTTLGKEYGAYGGHYEVHHHTQMIAHLVGQGKLQMSEATLARTTFHDPCYLGRHNGEFDAPRDALAHAGSLLLEMERSKSNSFCCGAGGAQFWKEEEHGSQAVNANRFAEARATGAQTLAVGCPFCAVMLKDANREAGEPMVVKDVAEIVAESLAPAPVDHDAAH